MDQESDDDWYMYSEKEDDSEDFEEKEEKEEEKEEETNQDGEGKRSNDEIKAMMNDGSQEYKSEKPKQDGQENMICESPFEGQVLDSEVLSSQTTNLSDDRDTRHMHQDDMAGLNKMSAECCPKPVTPIPETHTFTGTRNYLGSPQSQIQHTGVDGSHHQERVTTSGSIPNHFQHQMHQNYAATSTLVQSTHDPSYSAATPIYTRIQGSERPSPQQMQDPSEDISLVTQVSDGVSNSSKRPCIYNLTGNKGVKFIQHSKASSQLKAIQDQTRLRLERDLNMKVFVKTEKVSQCEKQLKTWGLLLISGGPGEGKTTAGLYLLQHMVDTDSRVPLILTDPSQWDHLQCFPYKKTRYAVFVDDAFGRTNLVEDLRTRWEQKFSMILPLIDMNNVYIIFGFRTNIFSLSESNLKTNALFQKGDPVIFSTNEFSEKEKLDILESHLSQNKVELRESDKMKIIQSCKLISFPLCCYLFTTRRGQLSDYEFFNKSLLYLSEVVSDIRQNDSVSFLVFLLVMFYENFLPKAALNIFKENHEYTEKLSKLAQLCSHKPTPGDVLKAAKAMCQTYLLWDQEKEGFSFVHNAIHDVVFFEFCKDYLSIGLEMCSARTLLEYVRIRSQATKECTVLVSERDFKILAQRLVKEIVSPDNQHILTHEAFKDAKFLKWVYSFLTKDAIQEIISYKGKQKEICVPQYLTDNTKAFWINHCLNQPTKQVCFDPKPFSAFEFNTIVASFVMSGADRIAVHILKRIKQENGQAFLQQANIMLVCSFYKNNCELVNELIELGAEITFSCFKAVCVATTTDDYLIELAAGILKKTDESILVELLQLCIELGKYLCIKHLIQAMDGRNDFLMMESIFQHLLLVSHNAMPSWIQTSAEHTYLIVQTLELFHSQGVWCSSDTCVLLASGCNNVSILKTIRNFGGNMSCRSKTGQTPLHLAALYGSADTVHFLLLNGVEKHARDDDEYTPLHRAAQSSVESSEKVIMLADQETVLETKCGVTPLDIAIKKGDINCVVNICDKVKRKNQLGYPLHLAVTELLKALSKEHSGTIHESWIKKRTDIVRHLVKSGFSLADIDGNGQSVLQLLIKPGNTDLCQSLISEVCCCKILIDIQGNLKQNNYLFLMDFVSERFDNIQKQTSHGNIKDLDIMLLSAARHGLLDEVKILNKNGAQINSSVCFGKTPLHSAVENNHIEIVKYLVEEGASVNATDGDLKTPLHSASENSHIEIVKYLVEEGASVNATDGDLKTPLHSATENNHIEKVKYLVEKGAHVNSTDSDLKTPLHSATDNNHFEIVKYLVEKGASVNATDRYRKTPLHSAVENNQIEIVRYLDERGARWNTESDSNILLHSATKNNHIEIVKYLVEKGASVNATDGDLKTPLHSAFENNHIEIVKYLVEKGASMNATDCYLKTPLHSASKNNHIEIVKYLVEKGASVNTTDRDCKTPLHSASENNHIEIVQYLVEKGASVNATDGDLKTPLHNASKNNHIEIVKYLVEKGASGNATDGDEKTPLHSASKNNHIEIVKYLVEKGASLNATDCYRKTPLHCASENNHIEIVKYLVEKGASVNATDFYRKTPLHSASENNYIEIVKYLVEKGASVNATDGYRKTPLHSASENNHIEIVKYLIEKGASVNATDFYRKTSLHSASENNYIEIVKYLVEKGASVNATDGD